MTTAALLRRATFDLLYGQAGVERPAEDMLNGAINSSVLALTVDTASMWTRGTIAEFVATDEAVIFGADASGSTAVRRAQLGTTAASQADNAVMLKNPKYLGIQVDKMVDQVIRNDLWPHVWTWHHDSVSATATDSMYALDDHVEEVVVVYQENVQGDAHWHPLPNAWWDVEREINTIGSSGNMLRLRKVHDYDETVYYTAKLRADPSDAGLTAMADELADMVPWAAAAKLLAGRSAQVKTDPARTRQDQEGALLRDYRGLMAEFLRMRDQYARTLTLEVSVEPRFRRKFRRAW